MKIALNIEWVGARRGGAEKYAGTLARALHAAGHEVHLFARGVDDDETPPQVRIHEINVGGRPGFGWSRTYRFAASAERVLRRQKFDLIIGFNKTWHQDVYLAVAGTGPASNRYGLKRFRNPLVRWWHQLGKWISPKQRFFRRIEQKQFVERSPHVVACSEFSAQHFRDDHDVPSDRISIVYNGFDPKSLDEQASKRAAFRAAQQLDDGTTALLFTARNYALKGLEPLLESFARVASSRPDCVLMVCGARRDAAFRRQARRLGMEDRVRFLGFVNDVDACFAGCDLFVFPTFYDPCSLVVPEALHAGLPVITSGANGAGELIVDGVTGYVIDDPWNSADWAERMTRLVDDVDLRRRMSEQARKHASRMTMDVRIGELSAVIRKLTAGRTKTPSKSRRAA